MDETRIRAEHHPIEVAPRLWWVGHYLEGDPFQCHAYLLEQGDQSVLFDPGSALTVAQTLHKIEQVVSFADIRYFVCHHQDPDIVGALPLLDPLIARDDALLVTHWRARVLLKHLALKHLTFWNIEENGWQLELEDRTLEFVFTPYAHFPGAFVTLDGGSGTLMSSDLFGGFTEGFQLYAPDESYFESMRPFHEHYIPSREVMQHVLDSLDELEINQIAPQHGSIIRRDLVPYMMSRLRELDCGLYLLAEDNTEVLRLSRLNRLMRDVTATLLRHRDFKSIAHELVEIASSALAVEGLEFYATLGDGSMVAIAPETRYRTTPTTAPSMISSALSGGVTPSSATLDFGGWSGRPGILVPLTYHDHEHASAVAVLRMGDDVGDLGESLEAVERIAQGLAVAVEREVVEYALRTERERMYETSVRDPLTGLYTRRYLSEAYANWAASHDRHPERGVALVLLDIDHFKRVNDTWGHVAGDRVLASVGAVILDAIRAGDVAVRYGGEEIAVFLLQEVREDAARVAERLLERVRALAFDDIDPSLRVTVSAGVADRRAGDQLSDLLRRADEALYEAKRAGRDRVCVAGA